MQALQRRKSYDTEYYNQPEIEVHEINQLRGSKCLRESYNEIVRGCGEGKKGGLIISGHTSPRPAI